MNRARRPCGWVCSVFMTSRSAGRPLDLVRRRLRLTTKEGTTCDVQRGRCPGLSCAAPSGRGAGAERHTLAPRSPLLARPDREPDVPDARFVAGGEDVGKVLI